MFNIKQTVKGNTLIMEVDLTQTSGLSKSGKNTIVASTNGNAEVEGRPNIKFGLNVFTKAE